MKNKKLSKWMKNKKIVAGILCIACVGTLCTGCSGSATAGGNNEPETEKAVYGTELETETTMVATSENMELPETTETPEGTTTELPEELPAPETAEPETEQKVVETVAKQETAKQEPVTSQPETTEQDTTNETVKPETSTETAKPANDTKKEEVKEDTKKEENKEETKEDTKKEETKEENKKEEVKPSHTHDWKPIYKTVHHDAVYETETYTESVLVTPAWTEEVWHRSNFCITCESQGKLVDLVKGFNESGMSDINEYIDTHISYHNAKNENCQYGTKSILIETIEHPAVYKDEVRTREVLVSEAYDEKVLVGYECECGATK